MLGLLAADDQRWFKLYHVISMYTDKVHLLVTSKELLLPIASLSGILMPQNCHSGVSFDGQDWKINMKL